MKQPLQAIFGVCGLALYVLAAAGDPSVDATKSNIVATFRQEDVPVDSAFKQFTGQVDYDPAHPTAAKATLQVATGSLDMGSPDYDNEVRKKEWLDSTTYPNATFVSSTITAGSAGHLTANGTLTLKGKTQQLAVPVVVTRAGSQTAFDGTLQISRKYFGIGTADWNDVLDDVVNVRFHIVE